jgi:hydroxymethylpyrimidine pyrophosphatase-like HAD family hydrolase
VPRIAAFATDLDRTLLRPGGRPTWTGRTALREARAMGLRTLLVSGRKYPQLVRFALEFEDLDGIVAENGGVVEAPLGSPPTVVAHRAAVNLHRQLAGRTELHCDFGQVVVSVPMEERQRLLDALGGLPFNVEGNIDRVMVLPYGVTKRTGTRVAMRKLGLPHGGYAAIGDAENDLELLGGASLAGAVANAEPKVRAQADYICRGRHDRGVLEFVRGPLAARVAETRAPTGVTV